MVIRTESVIHRNIKINSRDNKKLRVIKDYYMKKEKKVDDKKIA